MSREVVNDLIKKAVVESAPDPAYFCRFFLRKWFPLPLSPFQLGALALFTRKVSFLDKYPESHDFILRYFRYKADPADPSSVEISVFFKDEEGRMHMVAGDNNAVIMPRGFSKTTLMKAAFLYALCTDGNTFGVYVSESSKHSIRQLGDLKKQFERNKLLKQAYGDLVPGRTEAEKWGADEIQLTNGAILVALGRGSQVRGLLYDGKRPNKVLLDDVEDKESVSTAEQRQKVSDWFYSDVVPAGNQMEIVAEAEEAQEPMQITVVGTLLGADALLMTLQNDITFNCITFGAVVEWEHDEQGNQVEPRVMLWPEKMGKETYLFQRNRYKRNGKLAEFVREYDSAIRTDEDAMFSKANISLYLPVDHHKLVQIAIAGDPAISDQPGRDHSALVVTGRAENGILHVLDVWGKLGATPREIIDKLFWFFILFGKRAKVGIESQQYQKSLIFIAREEMARRQLFFPITPIIQGNDKTKDDRIAGILQPRYANGYVRHQRPFPDLENQLADFPNGKKDYADALAMSFSLLGETAMLVAPAESVTQDEYEPLSPPLPAMYNPAQHYNFSRPALPHPLRSGRYG